MPVNLPQLPPLDRCALLLDIDGTLLEFAPTPMEVVVPPDLPLVLQRLKTRMDGALGMISGRPIEQIDLLFPRLPTAVAGEHGGAFRHSPDAAVIRPDLPTLSEATIQSALALGDTYPGAVIERKLHGLVLHYRDAPEAEADFAAWVQKAVASENTRAGHQSFLVLPAKMAWEIRPSGIDKGIALSKLMRHPPFDGRIPIFIGDDVTDMDAIRCANDMGGCGFLVDDVFGSPKGVRCWLASLK